MIANVTNTTGDKSRFSATANAVVGPVAAASAAPFAVVAVASTPSAAL